VLVRRQERAEAVSAAAERIVRERERALAEQSQRLEQLDDAIDHYKARFADLVVALEYDTKTLTAKYSGGGDRKENEGEPMLLCLGQRAHWVDCTKKYGLSGASSLPCDAYLSALEKCVNEAIVKPKE